MIVVDASAVLAVLQEEPEYEEIVARLLADEDRRISPVSRLEIVMVLSRQYSSPISIANDYMRRAQISLHPIDAEQADYAQYAFLTYGKGRHPARLNLGDCFSYAAARALNAPILHVGADFSKTDIQIA